MTDVFMRDCLDCGEIFGCHIAGKTKECGKCDGGLKGECLDVCAMKTWHYSNGMDVSTGICRSCLEGRKVKKGRK